MAPLECWQALRQLRTALPTHTFGVSNWPGGEDDWHIFASGLLVFGFGHDATLHEVAEIEPYVVRQRTKLAQLKEQR